MASRKNKQRTYARNRNVSRRGNPKYIESDGVFFLKLITVIILGTFWVKFGNTSNVEESILLGLPMGLVIGLFLIWKLEKSAFNRRLWYSTIVLTAIVSVFLPTGVII